ncbi:MAG: cell division protein FtsZ [Bacteroidia bacterium]|nr:cell division protein FtsZ [Bacteroidia bacterium]
MNFDLPKDQSSIIKVIGVGGGGSNAVNHMYRQGIKGVDFIVCNTDQQALDISPVPLKIALGSGLTEGRGAGSIPDMGRKATLESLDEIKKLMSDNTKMVFITAGLGGGTGTGGAPVIAQAAKELGILTVAIVTVPFAFEGKKRKQQAEEGLAELRKYVDTILIINNDKLREMYGNLKLSEAFAHADNILNMAAKSIAEIITVTLHINLDFADVQTVMTNSGVAIMGSASAEGENRAIRAVEMALSSPLLNDNNIKGARYVLLNITCGNDDITMDELGGITDYLQEAAGQTADIIKGYGIDETLGNRVNVTLIATGFSSAPVTSFVEKKAEKIIRRLDDNIQTPPPAAPKTETPAPVATTPVPVPQNTPEPLQQPLPVLQIKPESDMRLVTKLPEPAKTEVPAEPVAEKLNSEVEFEVVKKALDTSRINFIPPAATVPPVVTNAVPSADKRQDMPEDELSEEQKRKAQERIEKLRQLSYKLRSPGGITELENEPAYKRRNINIDETAHSSDNGISRYTLSEGEAGKSELKPNNGFLHEHVD